MDVLATGVQRDERPLLERAFAPRHQVRCLETPLTADTLPLAVGYEAVSTSVEGTLDASALEALVRGGTRLITQRSTGYNNIDLAHAERLGLTVARVTGYSPYAVAELPGRWRPRSTAGSSARAPVPVTSTSGSTGCSAATSTAGRRA